RIDQLLLAGSGDALLVPVIAAGDPHVRHRAAVAPLPPSPERDEIGPITTIAHGQSRIVALSEGDAASLFPPPPQAAVLVVSGDDPEAAWESSPAIAL